MKFQLSLILFFTTALSSHALFAQKLEDQYKTVVEDANNFQEYKVIKQTQIRSLWKNTTDSLRDKQTKLNSSAKQINNQKLEISNLQNSLKVKEAALQEALSAKDEISLLGFIPLSKSSYKMTMWILVFILAALTIFLYLRTAGFKKEARYRIKLFEELSDEFKNYKIKANDNEKKLARALQDEKNKLDELYRR